MRKRHLDLRLVPLLGDGHQLDAQRVQLALVLPQVLRLLPAQHCERDSAGHFRTRWPYTIRSHPAGSRTAQACPCASRASAASRHSTASCRARDFRGCQEGCQLALVLPQVLRLLPAQHCSLSWVSCGTKVCRKNPLACDVESHTAQPCPCSLRLFPAQQCERDRKRVTLQA